MFNPSFVSIPANMVLEQDASSRPAKPKPLLGINHIKLPAYDLRKTYDFYTAIFSMQTIPQYDHYDKNGTLFAQMFRHSSTGTIVEIRQNRTQALAQKGWDPITWSVKGVADLDDWGKYLDTLGVKHSKVLKGVKGWTMGVEDPDGKIVRLYTEDEHEWTNHPDEGLSFP